MTQASYANGVAGRRWWGNHVRELGWQWELAQLCADPLFYGVGVPQGSGRPVLLLPGFLASDTSLSVLSGWLLRTGHRPHRSGTAVANIDCADRALDRVERRLERVAERADDTVALVGHSRGGQFARALAHRRPDLVRCVVALGSPLVAPYDVSAPTLAAVDGVRAVLRRTGRAREAHCFTPGCSCRYVRDFAGSLSPDVPLTSVYSRADGVVRWRACVVPGARNVEVPGTHIGLAVNRHAYRAVAAALTA